jgi:hypothetical protein
MTRRTGIHHSRVISAVSLKLPQGIREAARVLGCLCKQLVNPFLFFENFYFVV